MIDAIGGLIVKLNTTPGSIEVVTQYWILASGSSLQVKFCFPSTEFLNINIDEWADDIANIVMKM